MDYANFDILSAIALLKIQVMIKQSYVDYEGVKLKFEYSFLMNGELIEVSIEENPFIYFEKKYPYHFDKKDDGYKYPLSINTLRGNTHTDKMEVILPLVLERIKDFESKLPNTLYKGLNPPTS